MPRTSRKHGLLRISLLVSAVALTTAVLWHELRRPTKPFLPPTSGHVANDMSGLNATTIAQFWDAPDDESAAETGLRDILQRARARHLHVSIAGAGHSMGGQTIAPEGIRINMLPVKSTKLDEASDILHVGSGALWADVIPYLDRYGRSVAVMQSNNNFTVGGSLSVNCHGWQYGAPPIASTVESLHLMKADGSVLRCSRTENKELFSLALGGYGLFGIILDADLHVVRNQRLRMRQTAVPLDAAMASFNKELRERGAPSMFYARLNITPKHMFDSVLIATFYPESGDIPKLGDPKLLGLRRALFRESVDSDFGKAVRWQAETKIAPHLAAPVFSRNQLMDESTAWYSDHTDATTDILHEYFLPQESAISFR